MGYEDLMPSIRSQKTTHCLTSFICHSGKAKFQGQKIDQCLPGISDQRVAPKGNGNVWGGGKVLYLDLGGGHTTEYLFPKGTLQVVKYCM